MVRQPRLAKHAMHLAISSAGSGGTKSLMVAPLGQSLAATPVKDRPDPNNWEAITISLPASEHCLVYSRDGNDRLYRIGLVRKVVRAISCDKLLLALVISAISLDTAIAYVDMIVLPLLAIQGDPFNGGADVKTHRSKMGSALN